MSLHMFLVESCTLLQDYTVNITNPSEQDFILLSLVVDLWVLSYFILLSLVVDLWVLYFILLSLVVDL